MKYSDNTIVQKFIEQLVDALKYKNECKESYDEKFNIPFLVSALWQDLMNNCECYNEFCSDLKDYDNHYIIIEDDNYLICKVNVFLYNEIENDDWKCEEEPNFLYEIVFGYDERHWGYCKCSPRDKDYRKDKHCCGHGCDWDAPWIMVRKSFLISEHSWSGDEHDYWDFEDKFYANDNEENEKKLLTEREYKIKSLKETIENAQKELKKLENL